MKNNHTDKMQKNLWKSLLTPQTEDFFKYHLEHLSSQKKAHRKNFFGVTLNVPPHVYNPNINSSSFHLYSSMPTFSNKSVLDMGCGSGAIGLAIKKNHNNCTVTLSDIDYVATGSAKENAHQNSLDVKVKQSDLFKRFKTDEKFDVIVFNLPFFDHDYQNEEINQNVNKEVSLCDPGMKITNKFLSEYKNYLNPNGECYIVLANISSKKTLKTVKKKYNGFIVSLNYSSSGDFVKAVIRI